MGIRDLLPRLFLGACALFAVIAISAAVLVEDADKSSPNRSAAVDAVPAAVGNTTSAVSPSQQFLDHVHAATSLREDDSITLAVGEQICYELANGTASGISVRDEFRQSSYTPSQQDAIYRYASEDLC